MRKIIPLTLVILMWSGVALGQEWHTANQVTIGWDPVTTLVGGVSIDTETSLIKYAVYIKNAVTGGEPVQVTETEATEFTITLGTEGKYFLGVQSLRYNADGSSLVAQSEVAWSDNPESCQDGEAFGVQYFEAPDKAGGLHVQ